MKSIQMPYEGLAKAIGVPDIYLKRDDQHKYGSHKGRSIPLMIKNYSKEGYTKFVISSSGNAALAAIHGVQVRNKNNPDLTISLDIYVGEKIDPKKLKALEELIDEENKSLITLHQVAKPKQIAFQKEKEKPEEIKYLRQSTDDMALEGYFELAQELSKIPNLHAVFVGTSSGTCSQGILQYFMENNIKTRVHIVQTTSCHPIAGEFDSADNDEISIAGAIVDKVAHRKEKLVEMLRETKGSGWIVTNKEIEQAQSMIKKHAKIEVSPNGALGVAGLIKARRKDINFSGPVVAILCGQ